jgi:hypothetical protein
MIRILSLAAITLSGTSACGGGGTDIESTLRFEDLSDTEIARLVNAASGAEGFQAQGRAQFFEDPFEPDPCPTIEQDGDRVTITGGCTTAGGEVISGSIEITNPLDWGDYEWNFGRDSLFVFDQFTTDSSGFTTSVDGTFRLGSSYSKIEMDLVTESFGVAVRSDIFIDYGTSSASIKRSGVELIGVGGARVSGKVRVGSGGATTADIKLEGADTVRVTVENNCVSWRIEGTERSFSPCDAQ